ncbi:LamB/YcsF family protein [Rhodobacteraceae bacterium HSP-20]|uniref:5-oxoprolinase subunit A n=1 Tax=Paragemmobacter amnigenus TaxID=2852097 RepID=A0ABS6J4N3_9RHOB|nr:5-oxoprolinase subunit PxpA [Rhodobacter amnigenus]MBU9698721.1 LamB/YcsF family protein [Rhodobacter amnigenus]MBV4389948.1 LamB/YcsF family protein [Rhodobacter amnigenus]
MARVVDLNSDLGESFGPWVMGNDAAMLDIVSSANVACGGHAGDPEVMYATLRLAAERGVVVGAHPGYADREGFGRRVIPMAPAEIGRMVAAQVGALQGVAALAGVTVRYVKAHGALANLAAERAEVAAAVAGAVAALPGRLMLLAISGTELEVQGRKAGLDVVSEVFADRAYQANGQLVPRSQAGAVLHDPDAAAERMLRFLETGRIPVLGGGEVALAAGSICVHGDNPAAVEMARTLRARLEGAGVSLRPFAGG